MMQILKLNKTQFVRHSTSISWVIWHGIWDYQKRLQNYSIKTEWEKLAWKRIEGIIFSIQRQCIQSLDQPWTLHVYCHNIQGLLVELGITIYNSTEWRLFIDSSKRSLKCILLQNPPPQYSIQYCTQLGRQLSSPNWAFSLSSWRIRKHTDSYWVVAISQTKLYSCVDLQRGYTKYPCFLCMLDCRVREKHWVEMTWPPWSDLKPGDPNILHESLVDRKKTIFPPLHIILGLMKQFVKTLTTTRDCFK